jgi:hypothetical protein
MKLLMEKLVLLFLPMVLISCETPSATVTASTPASKHPQKQVSFSGGNGSSFAAAIVVHAADELSGVQSEYAYIRAHHPGYHFVSQALTNHGGKLYDIMIFASADGKKHTLYFDISSYFGRL